MIRAWRELPPAIWILAGGTLVNRAGAMLLPFLTIYLSVGMGRSVAFATGTMAAYGAGSLAAALLGGHLADAIGRKRVMLLSMTGGAALLLVWSALESPVAIVAVAALTALVLEMYRPASAALVADLVPPAQRPLAFGLQHVAINLGFAVAPFVGGMLAERSFFLIFAGDAATTLLCAAILARFITDPAPPALPGTAVGSGPVSPAAAFRVLAGDRTFLTFCVASLLVAAIYVQASSTLPLFLTGAGYSPSEFGRLIAVNGLLIVVIQLPVTALVSRFDRGLALAAAATLVGIGFALHAAGTSVPAVLLAIVVWTVGETAMAPLAGSFAAELAPEGWRARYLGLFTFSYTAAILVGAPVGGAVLSRWGGQALWGACLGTAIVCAALFARCGVRSLSRTRRLDPVG